MANYIIVEDERPAYEELKRMISLLRPGYRLTGWADSIEQAKVILSASGVDLIFMDIHLADGLAFDIFGDAECDIPVVFTTAYDEYALDAFRAGGIDYLLKPVDEDDLERALHRFEKGSVKPLSENAKQYRHRFLVKVGDSYVQVPVGSVALFHTEDKCTLVTLLSGRSYIVESTLDTLEQQLDSARFFRVSRSRIVNIEAITRCTKLFGGRLHLHLTVDTGSTVTVSRARTLAFLEWFDGLI